MALALEDTNQAGRVCDIMLTFCNGDKGFGSKLAGTVSFQNICMFIKY